MQGDRPAAPRRVEVLAIIVESIARFGTCPSYDEIGRAMVPPIGKTRVAQHVDGLVEWKCIDRGAGAQRGIRIRDLNLCRFMIERWLGEKGWWHARPLGVLEAPGPCTTDQLPLVPPFEPLSGVI